MHSSGGHLSHLTTLCLSLSLAWQSFTGAGQILRYSQQWLGLVSPSFGHILPHWSHEALRPDAGCPKPQWPPDKGLQHRHSSWQFPLVPDPGTVTELAQVRFRPLHTRFQLRLLADLCMQTPGSQKHWNPTLCWDSAECWMYWSSGWGCLSTPCLVGNWNMIHSSCLSFL